MNWWHWIVVHVMQETGTDSSSSRAYNFWSGFGSDIGEVAIISSLYAIYRKHNCVVHHCFRICRYDVVGTPYQACKKHHPEVPTKAKITPGVIVDACTIEHDRKDHHAV